VRVVARPWRHTTLVMLTLAADDLPIPLEFKESAQHLDSRRLRWRT
jgi:hypothetical protein